MFIVVSDYDRMPPDIQTQLEHWSLNEFITKAGSEEGIDIDEGIFFHTMCLTQDMYQNLLQYEQAGVVLIYYRFDDEPQPSFPMMSDIREYPTAVPEPEPEPEPQYQPPMEEQVQQQPVIEEPQYQQQPVMEEPQYQQPQQPVAPEPQPVQVTSGVNLVTGTTNSGMDNKVRQTNISNLIQMDPDEQPSHGTDRKAAKVLLFGSSKGGTGKTFTCIATAYWYAKTHPNEKVALADFDIIDGQVGITVNKIAPTLQNYYNIYMADPKNNKNIYALHNNRVQSENFSPNIDFYLAPSQDIPQITNNLQFWTDVFQLLITNYDVVFFDSGIDYLGKPPISQLYKIADKILITCNPSINSVKSIVKQFKTLSGKRVNNVFRATDDIMSRVNIILTRVYDNQDINEFVVSNLVKHAPVIAAFGNIDNIISRIHWYQEWTLIDTNPEITESLTEIASLE